MRCRTWDQVSMSVVCGTATTQPARSGAGGALPDRHTHGSGRDPSLPVARAIALEAARCLGAVPHYPASMWHPEPRNKFQLTANTNGFPDDNDEHDDHEVDGGEGHRPAHNRRHIRTTPIAPRGGGSRRPATAPCPGRGVPARARFPTRRPTSTSAGPRRGRLPPRPRHPG